MRNFYLKIISFIFIFTFLCSGFAYGVEFDLEDRTVGMSMYTFNPEYLEEFYWDRINKVEDNYNVNFKFNYIDDPVYFRENVLTHIWEENYKYNIIQFDFSILSYLVENQALHSLDEYLPADYFKNLPAFYQVFKEAVSLNGHIFAIPSYEETPIETGSVILYNADLFRKEDLTTPHELYQNEEWNWDTMTQIARETTKTETDIKQWGMGYGFEFRILDVLQTYYAPIFKTTDDDKIKFTMTDSRTIEALNYFYRWHNKYKLVFPSYDYQENITAFENQEIAMLHVTLGEARKIIEKNNVEDNIRVIYFPKEPKKDNYVLPFFPRDITAIPITVEQPEILLSIYHNIFKPEDSQQIINGIINSFSEADQEILWNMISKGGELNQFRSSVLFTKGQVNERIMNAYLLLSRKLYSIMKGGQKPQEAIQEIADQIQSTLDEEINR